ncbi:MAG: cytochrome c family protein [Gemmatales bacterium]|nr:cytochrome c family protein [Gemmatales bacterium]MDW7994263.1 cytochrome c family protein [Gemmatales bacterium]
MLRVWERVAILGALLSMPVALVSVAVGYRWWSRQLEPEPRLILQRPVVAQPDPIELIMRAWREPAPELVLAFSGQMYGYLQPCGCARPQVGGLERRYELVQRLRQAGWPVIGFDLGDLGRLHHEIKQGVLALPQQSRLKYEIAWRMLHKLDWQVVGIGPEELLFPLEEVFGFALNTKPPVLVCTNLNDPDMLQAGAYVRWFVCELPSQSHSSGQKPPSLPKIPTEFLQPTPIPALRRAWRIACLAVLQESELSKIRKQLTHEEQLWKRFLPVETALTDAWQQLSKNRPDLVILLHHGTAEEARALASRFDWLHVVLSRDLSDVASSVAEPLPSPIQSASRLPPLFKERLVVRVGHKGKALGLVAVRRDSAQPTPLPANTSFYRLDYRMVELTEHFELPGEKTNAIRELMKEYVEQVYMRDFLKEWVTHRKVSHPQQLEHPQAAFVGVQACAECHKNACQIWNNSKHSQAYAALVKYGQPQTTSTHNGRTMVIGRQYDPECLICHTTGFEYKTGFRNERETPHLFANGCENCHGPASLHVQFPNEPRYWQPLKRAAEMMKSACRACHDSENDPHFDFAKYWPKIAHKKDPPQSSP